VKHLSKHISPAATVAIALGAGLTAYFVGEAFKARYNSLTPEQKLVWDQNRILHHGTVGLLMTAGGLLLVHPVYTPIVTGAGMGLVISDKDDFVQKP